MDYNLSDVFENIPTRNMWVDEQYRLLKEFIQEYERSLDDRYAVGLRLTSFGESVLMQVSEISYAMPVLMIFKGWVDDKESILIQHINQLNFLITQMEIKHDEKKNPIGFQ